jgi:hypothetical protein
MISIGKCPEPWRALRRRLDLIDAADHLSFPKISSGPDSRREAVASFGSMLSRGPNCLTVSGKAKGRPPRKGGIRAAARALGLTRHRLGPHRRGLYKGLLRRVHILSAQHQRNHGKAELRAQGIQALAQVTTPIIKLPMKIKRKCGRCGDFNSVLVEPGQAVPAFKCSACGYPAG